MSIESQLLQRSDSQCELCTSNQNLSIFEVAPSDGSSDQSVMVCAVCQEQLNDNSAQDANHWRSLNDSMWSPTPAVQVVAWRQLSKLSALGEVWAQELLDIMYMEEDVKQWAEALTPESSDDDNREPTRDCNGVILEAGDTVTIIKDLDVKGAGFTAKRGTAVRNIGLTNNPEHIEGRVNGQRIVLLSCYMKKS